MYQEELMTDSTELLISSENDFGSVVKVEYSKRYRKVTECSLLKTFDRMIRIGQKKEASNGQVKGDPREDCGHG
jgi:hypothetical protein